MSLRAPSQAVVGGAARRRSEVACLARAANPYLRLLYEQLEEQGFGWVEAPPRLSLGWLRAQRRTVRFLHFHWPEGQYRYEQGPPALRPLLSWAKLAVFACRLAAARALGYRLVWTIHQLRPHETTSPRLDRVAAVLLARSSHLLLVHDEATREAAREELGRTAARARVVPHGSYLGVYRQGRPREDVRAELGLPDDAFVFLIFGHVRPYKDIELALEAFSEADLSSAALVVAGPTRHELLAETIRSAARRDPRIRPVLEFVDDDRVAELFDASDAAIVARGDGGTSGSLILALSLGKAVVFADTATYRDLTENGRAGWPFEPGDSSSLGRALEQAAAGGDAERRGLIGLGLAEGLRWSDSARELACSLRKIAPDDNSTSERTSAMTYVLKLLAGVERRTEAIVGAVLRGTVAVLVRLLKRGRHRPWRSAPGA